MNDLGWGIGVGAIAWAVAWGIYSYRKLPEPSVECVRAGGHWYELKNKRDGDWGPHCEAKEQP